ncbi:ATP-binding cassette domain-containing protein [Weissella viridescens]
MCSTIKLKLNFYNVSYPLSTSTAILDHVNLHLSAGICQLVGVNGVGKSTILKTLNGDLHVDKFTVLLNNKPIDIYNTTSIFLFDDKFIGYEFLRPHEYINLIAMTFNLKINSDIMNYLFLKTGLSNYDHTLIKNLSQGNQQKLVICRLHI